jgi:chromosome segregation ATPase
LGAWVCYHEKNVQVNSMSAIDGIGSEENARRAARHTASNVSDAINDARRQGSKGWDFAEELQRDNERLRAEADELREHLARSNTLVRLTGIQAEGLLNTVRHLKRSWSPDDPKEADLKNKIKPLVDKQVEAARKDPSIIAKIEADINECVFAGKRKPRSSM